MNKKRLLQNLTLLFGTILVCSFLIEMICRVQMFGWDAFSPAKMNSIHYMGKSYLLKPSEHPEIVFELKPGLNTYFKMARMRTNSRGLRDKEYSLEKPRDTFRVAVIGDSFTMCSGVEIEDVFHSVLEDRLNSENRGMSYEFINFAVAGYCLRQYRAVAEHKALQYDPDLILIGFCVWNDFRILPEEVYRKTYKVKGRSYPIFRPYALIRLRQTLRNAGIIPKRAAKAPSAPVESEIESAMEMFSQLGALSRAKNIPVVVLSLDVSPRDVELLEDLVTSNDLRFFDVSGAFRGKRALNFVIRPVDFNHPNARANRIFATEILEYLDGERLLDRHP
jgi:hypothetical protein